MQVDPAQAARHPAVAEYLLERQQARIATLEAALQRQIAEPLPPELVRARLADLPPAVRRQRPRPLNPPLPAGFAFQEPPQCKE